MKNIRKNAIIKVLQLGGKIMTQAEKDERLKELNKKCMECREESIKKGYNPPNPKSCEQCCKIGREIHKLENPAWDAQDWNSSKLEDLYHN